jgi:hypothetical protein
MTKRAMAATSGGIANVRLGDLTSFITKLGDNNWGANQMVFRFPNGYGASVIHGTGTYGVELAVTKYDGDHYELCYDTHVTNDVIGHLEQDSLIETLRAIQAL